MPNEHKACFYNKTMRSKRTMSVKRFMYVIFFNNQDPSIQIALSKGKSVHVKFYKGNVVHKRKYFKSRRPATDLCGVRLLHDNVSSHKAAIVREYFKQEKVVELPHPLYSPDLAPCDFFLFPTLKKTPCWKKISNAKKSRFGYFVVC
jgi:histone-lysine N-methyltransferase SETMAR